MISILKQKQIWKHQSENVKSANRENKTRGYSVGVHGTKSTSYGKQQTHGKGDMKIPTFLETLKGKKRSENKYSIRVNFSFNPKSGSRGELKRVAIELLELANRVDPNALLAPWENKDEELSMGPINLSDLHNPTTYIQEIIQYIHKPNYTNLRPGNTVFKYGNHIMFIVTRILTRHSKSSRWKHREMQWPTL